MQREALPVGRLALLGGVGPLRFAVEPKPAAAEGGVVDDVPPIRAAIGHGAALVVGEDVVADHHVLAALYVRSAGVDEHVVLHHVVEAVLVPPSGLEPAHDGDEGVVLPDVMVAEGDVLGRVVVAVEQERVADVEDAMIDV